MTTTAFTTVESDRETARVRVGLDYRPALLGVSGIGRSVRELARALAADPTVELHLFGHSWARVRRPSKPPPGSALHRLPIPGRSLPTLARLGLGADRLCGRVRVFHWTDYVHPPVSGGARVVLTLHDLTFADNPAFHGAPVAASLLARTREAAAKTTRIAVPSEATAQAAVRHLGVPRARIRVIPFGVDHVPRRPLARPAVLPEGDFVLCLGTIEPRKNHVRLLDAWRRLGSARPDLVVIGRPGWECDAAVRELRSATAEGRCLWLPEADDELVYAALQHCAVLAYPSLGEGFGFPALEALHLGRPVLAGDVPALRETLGPAALLVDPTDAEAIAHGLGRLLGERALREELSALGPTRAAGFRWSACARGYRSLYAEACR